MAETRNYLDTVREYADNVLEHGRDTYGDESTPMFVDGLDVETMEPPHWRYEGESWIFSNQASQQNLFRVFVALTRLTGDERYRRAAAQAITHMFEHYSDSSGQLRWGGHQFIDLITKEPVGKMDADAHEYKNHFPYYELYWEVDPAATKRMIEAVWNAHIMDWQRLDMNRHGPWNTPTGDLWDNTFGDPEPFFHGEGLTFINCGTDLIYAASLLSHFTGDGAPLTWAHRMANLYVKARDPQTGLGAYQYSQPSVREPDWPGPGKPRSTSSRYGDRCMRQFGPEFGDLALEGRILTSGRNETIYGNNAVVQWQLAELLGEDGEHFLTWTHDGSAAFTRHAYDPETNEFTPMFTDGTSLAGYELKRDGYYGREGTVLEKVQVSLLLFYSYALGYRITGDQLLWQTARGIARAHGLGDIGEAPGEGVSFNEETDRRDALAVFGLLELFKATGEGAYLAAAQRVGDNIFQDGIRSGFFVKGPSHVHSRFDDAEPLALLALAAAGRGMDDAVPAYRTGHGYIHGDYADQGRSYDYNVIWNQTR